MVENLRLARFFFLILAIVTVGRWLMGNAFKVPYEKGTSILSIVTATLYSSIFYAAFCRRWRGFRIQQAVVLAMTLAVIAQVVILVSTVLSYLLGIQSYFNHPIALNQPAPVGLGQALGIRVGGLVANTFLNGIAGALGWAMGALLPESSPDAAGSGSRRRAALY